MSHHGCPNHGTPFRPSPTGGNSHGGSSYSRQPEMDLLDRNQTNDFPAEAPPPGPFSHSIPRQPYNHALQNAWVPPGAPGHGQPEGHREDTPPPVEGVEVPGGVQAWDPHRIDMAYQGIVEYHPQHLANPAYMFPDVGRAQGIQAQVQPNALVNQERDLVGHHEVPDPPQAAFPHLCVHGIPVPNQPRPEDLRRLASRYWYHPNARVGMVSVEGGTTGHYKVVIILETPIGF